MWDPETGHCATSAVFFNIRIEPARLSLPPRVRRPVHTAGEVPHGRLLQNRNPEQKADIAGKLESRRTSGAIAL